MFPKRASHALGKARPFHQFTIDSMTNTIGTEATKCTFCTAPSLSLGGLAPMGEGLSPLSTDLPPVSPNQSFTCQFPNQGPRFSVALTPSFKSVCTCLSVCTWLSVCSWLSGRIAQKARMAHPRISTRIFLTYAEDTETRIPA